MKEFIKKNRTAAILGLLVVLLVTMTCSCPIPFNRIIPPSATPVPPPALGDYGDAPDGDQNMDTGYYAPTGGPFFFTYGNAGIAGDFPTMGEDPVPGPYTIDVDEFWIGPLMAGPNPLDEPSIEDDADDSQDPDGLANLQTPGGRADCDKENGSHDPAGNGCMPVPPFSIQMNARLSIFFGFPPLGVWFTAANASEDMTYEGPVYWNLLIDLNQNGKWDGGDEWVVRDKVFDLTPGEHETLISPAFKVPTSGMPWGRINFPFWVRSMVSSESVKDKVGSGNWDGRGVEEGFAVGEVEDYFVEWRPIGQILPNPPQPIQAGGCGADGGNMFEHILMGDNLELIPGDNVKGAEIFATRNVKDYWDMIGSVLVELDNPETTTLASENDQLVVEIDGRLIRVDPELAQTAMEIMVIPNLWDPSECTGSGPVEVTSGFFYEFNLVPPEEDGVFGTFPVTFEFIFGCPDNNKLTKAETIKEITVKGGSITFSGAPPFVNVTGEWNPEDGSFNAEGKGEVAGYSNITCTFEGTITPEGLNGQYTMGAKGGLPGGNSVTYQVTGAKATSEEAPVSLKPGVVESINAFFDVYNTAFADGNVDHLYQLLHPAVIELYGEDACRAYLGTIVETPTTLEYIDATRVGVWNYERDEAVIPVDFAYSVQANFTANDQTAQQELHLVLPGDNSVRWFTDCGDPVQ